MKVLREMFWWGAALIIIAAVVAAIGLWNILANRSIGIGSCQRVQVIATAATLAHDLGIAPETARNFVTDQMSEDNRSVILAIVTLAYESNLSIPEMYSHSGSFCQSLKDFAVQMRAE